MGFSSIVLWQGERLALARKNTLWFVLKTSSDYQVKPSSLLASTLPVKKFKELMPNFDTLAGEIGQVAIPVLLLLDG